MTARGGSPYRPRVSAEREEALREWHERAYQSLPAWQGSRVTYLGIDLVVPAAVFPPSPVSDLLGEALLAEVRPDDRVLDMGRAVA